MFTFTLARGSRCCLLLMEDEGAAALKNLLQSNVAGQLDSVADMQYCKAREPILQRPIVLHMYACRVWSVETLHSHLGVVTGHVRTI